jgi:hypothetical protein
MRGRRVRCNAMLGRKHITPSAVSSARPACGCALVLPNRIGRALAAALPGRGMCGACNAELHQSSTPGVLRERRETNWAVLRIAAHLGHGRGAVARSWSRRFLLFGDHGYFLRPNGRRLSGSRRAEGDERVRAPAG